MRVYQTLKARAIEKRDNAIRAARTECHRTIRLIDELAKALPAETDIPRQRRKGRRAGRQPIIELIADVMPKDKAFTIRDVMKGLRLAHPLTPAVACGLTSKTWNIRELLEQASS